MSKQKLFLLLIISVALLATKTWAEESSEEGGKEGEKTGGCLPRNEDVWIQYTIIFYINY